MTDEPTSPPDPAVRPKAGRWRRLALVVFAIIAALSLAVGIAMHRAVGTFAVSVPESLRGDEPGDLVSVSRIGQYPRFATQYLLDAVDLPEPITVQHGITLYRLRYQTTGIDGSPVVASGLVAIPTGSTPRDVVAYFHGTSAERTTAPSQSGAGEGLVMAAAVSGTGHLLVAPDYIGLGESHDLHPYMLAGVTASTSIDLMHAAQKLVTHLHVDWPKSLFLLGFSQGGHTTFAVQRALQQAADPDLHVVASAPIAGAFYLRDVSFPQALTGRASSHPFYLAYLAHAYAQAYGHPLDSILVEPYAKEVPTLFDGDHQTERIAAALPKNPRELFTSELLEAYDNGQPHWFLDALAENDVADWTPQVPVRIYYGEEDEDVSPEEAKRAAAEMKQRGADVQAISVGPFTHNASVLHAVPKALKWFSELSAKTPASAPAGQ